MTFCLELSFGGTVIYQIFAKDLPTVPAALSVDVIPIACRWLAKFYFISYVRRPVQLCGARNVKALPIWWEDLPDWWLSPVEWELQIWLKACCIIVPKKEKWLLHVVIVYYSFSLHHYFVISIMQTFSRLSNTYNNLTEEEIKDLCTTCGLVNFTSDVRRSFIMFSAQKP